MTVIKHVLKIYKKGDGRKKEVSLDTLFCAMQELTLISMHFSSKLRVLCCHWWVNIRGPLSTN